MKARSTLAFVIAGVLALPSFAASTWRTVTGEQWQGELSGVFGPIAVFAEKTASRQLSVDQLDDASLAKVADFIATQATAPAWSGSTSVVAKSLRNRLQILQGQKLVNYDLGSRPEPDFYLVYFGALWCGPCVRFSPELVSSYQQLKAAAGDRLELVFVSSDRDSGEQVEYVKKVRMPWPILKFSSVGSVAPIERWKGNGIPCLIALTRSGDVIFHSYRGQEYLGPKHVVQQVSQLLRSMTTQTSGAKRLMHRLAVIQHVRAVGHGTATPQPYLISMDPRRYRTLELKDLTADLEIDAEGHVANASFTPKLDAVIEYQLTQDATTWLFLPSVDHGRAVARRVQLPLKL